MCPFYKDTNKGHWLIWWEPWCSQICVFPVVEHVTRPPSQKPNRRMASISENSALEVQNQDAAISTRVQEGITPLLRSWSRGENEDNNGTFHELLCNNSDVHALHSCYFCFVGSLMLDKRAFVIGMGMS